MSSVSKTSFISPPAGLNQRPQRQTKEELKCLFIMFLNIIIQTAYRRAEILRGATSQLQVKFVKSKAEVIATYVSFMMLEQLHVKA